MRSATGESFVLLDGLIFLRMFLLDRNPLLPGGAARETGIRRRDAIETSGGAAVRLRAEVIVIGWGLAQSVLEFLPAG